MNKTKTAEERVEWKVNDKVIVVRRIGKQGVPTPVVGTIIDFSRTIRIDGELTATIKYDDTGDSYWHKLTEIKKVQ